MIATGRQIRAGRALAGMSQIELAAAASVVPAVLVRAEMAAPISTLKRKDMAAIREVFKGVRIEFVQKDGEIGARLHECGQTS